MTGSMSTILNTFLTTKSNIIFVAIVEIFALRKDSFRDLKAISEIRKMFLSLNN